MDTVFDNNGFTQNILTIPAGSSAFSRSLTDSLGVGDTDDYIRLELNQRGSLLLKLNPTTDNANLALLDSTGDPLDGLLYESNNPDGLADAIATDSLNPGVYFIRVSTPSTPAAENSYTLSVNTGAAGRADLLWRYYGTPANGGGTDVLWQMNGATFSSLAYLTPISDLNWKIQATGDFNGDGSSDYVWRNVGTGETVAWLVDANNNIQRIENLGTIADANWRVAGTGDFDRDGQIDLFWSNQAIGQNVVWYMNGTTFRALAFAPAVPGDPTWKVSTVGDFNLDGRPDLVWRNEVSGLNTIWLMDNTTLIGNQSIPSVPDTNWQINGAGDFNGDGHTDLVLRNYASGQNVIWAMNGTVLQSILPLGDVADPNWVLSAVVSAPSTSIDLAGNTFGAALTIGGLSTSGRYGDRIGSPSDPADYYKFTTSTTANVNVSLRGLTADASLELLAADGATPVVPGSNNPGTADEVIRTTLTISPGTYYIKVASTSTASTPYALNLSLDVPRDLDLVPTPNLGGSNPPAFRLTTIADTALPTDGFSLNTSPPTLRVHYDVRNNSLVTPATFKVAFYLSTDSVITPGANGDRLFTGVSGGNDFVSIANLAAGTSTGDRTIDLTLPAKGNPFWSGDKDYFIGVVVDSGTEVTETNETNNTVSASVKVINTGDPDVVGGALAVTPATGAVPGGIVRLTGTIKNIGTAPTTRVSAGDQLAVNFRLSNDTLIDENDLTFTSYLIIPTIAAGGSVNFDSLNTDPTTSPTAYFVNPFTLPTLAQLQAWSGYQGTGTRTYYLGVDVNPLNNENSFVPETTEGRLNNINYDYNGDGNPLNDNIAIAITV